MIPLLGEVSKDWHSSVTEDMRAQQIEKLIMGMQIPHNTPLEHDEKQLLATNAKVAEKEMFELANSRSQYYYMLAEKIYKFQQDLEQHEEHAMPSSDQFAEPCNSLHHLVSFLRPPLYEENKSEITTELRQRYTSKFKEDLKPSPHLDIPLDVAKKAESICFERASSLNDYYKYTTEVYKLKEALKQVSSNDTRSHNCAVSTSQDAQMETKFADAVAHVWHGETPDDDFNREMMQLLIAVEKHSLEDK